MKMLVFYNFTDVFVNVGLQKIRSMDAEVCVYTVIPVTMITKSVFNLKDLNFNMSTYNIQCKDSLRRHIHMKSNYFYQNYRPLQD